MEVVGHQLLGAGDWLEVTTAGVERWQLIAATATATLTAVGLADLLANRNNYGSVAKKEVVRFIKNIPAVKKLLDAEISNLGEEVSKSYHKDMDIEIPSVTRLPPNGWSAEQVENLVKDVLSLGSYNWQDGKISGGTFSGQSADYTDLMVKMFHATVWTNPLHFDVFPGARKMDAEVVAMTKDLMHCDDSCVGCVTSGGSESLMLVMKAYRDYARSEHGITQPEAVVCKTVHAAIDKAAHYLGIKLRKIDADRTTFKADVDQMKRAINSNTVLMVASAPDFSHGIIDDVEAIAALGVAKGVAVHVDCCMGGFILPFMDEAGYPLPPFDFRLPGVTSMSADTHKYGNAPKGSSVVIYRNKQLMHAQYFKISDWPGGIYATPTIAGSRAGVNVAVCWAAMLSHGRQGYVDTTRKIIANARKLKKELASIPHLQLMGDPVGPIVAVQSDKFNAALLVQVLVTKGWHLITLQNPSGVQICLTQLHCDPAVVQSLAEDVREAVTELLRRPDRKGEGLCKAYGMASSIPDKGVVEDVAKIFMDSYYYTPEDVTDFV